MSAARSREKSSVENAVSRVLRDNLTLLQRTAEELYQAVADLVAACSSSRPSNAVPPMLRAQTTAAALQGALEVLSRFVTVVMASAPAAEKEEAVQVIGIEPPEPPAAPKMPPPSLPTPMAAGVEELEVPTPFPEAAGAEREVEISPQPEGIEEVPVQTAESAVEMSEPAAGGVPVPFDISTLPWQEQELHRRANRVAKVSMQDIQLMRPEAVRMGRTKKDICSRLRDDIDKARKEYERRFPTILNQPVDYFYHWMVEILAEGNPEALGEYPYPSPVVHH